MLARSDKKFDWHDLEGKEILIGRRTGMPGLSFLRALKNQGIDEDKVKINESIEFAEETTLIYLSHLHQNLKIMATASL